MKVIAHQYRCIGTGMCESIAQHLFEVGDDSTVRIKNEHVCDADQDAVRRAVASCPTETLQLLEDQ